MSHHKTSSIWYSMEGYPERIAVVVAVVVIGLGAMAYAGGWKPDWAKSPAELTAEADQQRQQQANDQDEVVAQAAKKLRQLDLQKNELLQLQEELESVLEDNPDHAAAHAYLSLTLFELADEEQFQGFSLRQTAGSHAEKALTLNENLEIAVVADNYRQFPQVKAEQMIAQVEEQRRKFPDNQMIKAHEILMLAWDDQGSEVIKRGEELLPTLSEPKAMVSVVVTMANEYIDKGDLQNAERLYVELMERAPSANAQVVYGRFKLFTKKYDEAIALGQSAWQKSNNFIVHRLLHDGQYLKGLGLANQGKMREAGSLFLEAVKHQPNQSPSLIALAHYYHWLAFEENDLKKLDEAEQLWERAAWFQPGYPPIQRPLQAIPNDRKRLQRQIEQLESQR